MRPHLDFIPVAACAALLALTASCSFDGAGARGSDASPPRDARVEQPVVDGLGPDGEEGDGPGRDGPGPDAPLREDSGADVLPGDVLPRDMLPTDMLPADVLPGDIFQPDLNPCGGPCPAALGCDASKGRCYRVQPSTLTLGEFDTLYPQATGNCDLSPATDQIYTIDSDTSSFAGCAPHSQTYILSAGPDLRVYAFETLRVGPKATLRIIGDHAVLIYAKRTIVVEGDIDGSASEAKPGPGGAEGGADDGKDGSCWFAAGEGKGGVGTSKDDSGGGGGAGGKDGADGGDAGGQKGGDGGTGLLPSNLFVLRGGCGGGAGGGSDGDGGSGGAGGGGLHFTADQSITVSGTINVGGGGGDGGHYGDAGGGGGGGGTLVFESVSVTLSGVVAANGGGGGAGAKDAADNGAKDGDDGLPSATQALGGASASGASGRGGKGGTATKAEKGEKKENAGGGGGGAGRIHVRAPSHQLGGVISPAELLDPTISKN